MLTNVFNTLNILNVSRIHSGKTWWGGKPENLVWLEGPKHFNINSWA